MHYYSCYKRYIRKSIIIRKVYNQQSELFNKLKNTDTGPKSTKKGSFLNSVGLFLGAKKKVTNEFQNIIFPIKIINVISTPKAEAAAPGAKPEAAVPKETKNIYKLKVRKKFKNEIETNVEDINDEIFWYYFNHQSPLYLQKFT